MRDVATRVIKPRDKKNKNKNKIDAQLGRGGMTAGRKMSKRHRVDKFMGPLHHTLAQTQASEHERSPLEWKEKPKAVKNTHFMYCKRNWLAKLCTSFIFLQPFHLR